MLFKELLTTSKMEDPEERQAEDIKRSSNKKAKKSKITSKSTSISMKKFAIIIKIINFFFGIIVFGALGWLAWEGIQIILNN